MPKSQIISALDIGSSKIATIIAQKSAESGKINIIGAASIPSRGVKKGQIVNIEEATQAVIASVEAAERMAGVSINRIFVNIGSQNINSQNSQGVVAVAKPEGEIISDDVVRVIEAAQAVSLPSGQEIIHVIPMSFTVDSQSGIRDPVGMSGVRLEVMTHIITVSSIHARNITKCVSEIGAHMEQIVFSGLASSYSVLSETEKELGVVMVDIGGGTTDIAIFVEGSLAYSAVIPIGAKNVTNDLAIGLRVSLESAEKIKLELAKEIITPAMPHKFEHEVETKKDKKKKVDLLDLSRIGIKEEIGDVSRRTLIEGIIRPRMNEIFDLVGMHLKKSGLLHAVPSGLVMCGGGAQTVECVDTAKKRLGLPVRIGEPGGVYGLIEDISTPAYSSTIGLVLYAMDHEFEEESGFRMPFGIGKTGNSNVGGIAGKIVDVIKSLLP